MANLLWYSPHGPLCGPLGSYPSILLLLQDLWPYFMGMSSSWSAILLHLLRILLCNLQNSSSFLTLLQILLLFPFPQILHLNTHIIHMTHMLISYLSLPPFQIRIFSLVYARPTPYKKKQEGNEVSILLPHNL